MIKKVNDNYDKQMTYRELNKLCKNALDNKNYFEVLTISYAMIEDRFRSLFYYLYLVNDKEDDVLNDKIKLILSYKKVFAKIDKIGQKIKVLKLLISLDDYIHPYINDCNRMISANIGIDNFNDYLIRVSNWINVRNQIVHASFNKNINELKKELEYASNEGYKLAKTMSSYVNRIKANDIQISVRDKWYSIDCFSENADNIYDFVCWPFLSFYDTAINYDILDPHIIYDYTFDYSDFYNFIVCRFLDSGTFCEFISYMIDNLMKVKNIRDEIYSCLIKIDDKYRNVDIVKKYLGNKTDFKEVEIRKYSNDINISKININDYIDDISSLIKLCWIYPDVMNELDDKYKNDLVFMMRLMNINPYFISYASDSLKANEEIIKFLIKKEPECLRFCNFDLIKDKELIDMIIDSNPSCIEYLGDEYSDNYDLALKLVGRNGYNLRYFSFRIRNDKRIVKLAINSCASGILFAEYIDDEIIRLVLLKDYPMVINNIPDTFLIDRELFKRLYKKFPNYVNEYLLCDELLDDKKIIEKIYKNNGKLPKDFKCNSLEDIYLYVFKNNMLDVSALWISKLIRDNDKLMKILIKNKPSNIKYASDRLQNNKIFIIDLINKDNNILKYLNDTMRNDYDVVKASVSRFGTSIDDAGYSMKMNSEIAIIAIKKNFRAIKYISHFLRARDEFAINLINELIKDNLVSEIDCEFIDWLYPVVFENDEVNRLYREYFPNYMNMRDGIVSKNNYDIVYTIDDDVLGGGNLDEM